MVQKQIAAILMLILAFGQAAFAQDKPAARKAAAAPDSAVDTVVQLVQGGMSEAMIVRTLKAQNKPVNLTTADMLKLQKAKVSENIIGVMMDPGTAPVGPPAPAPAATMAAATVPASDPAPLTSEPAASCSNLPKVAAVAGSDKRRLAVNAFDYSTVKDSVVTWFGNDVNIGQSIRALLTTRMAQSKNVVLLEREKNGAVMKEQDFDATNRVKRGKQVKIGNIVGADAELYGDIVIFGRDDKKKGGGLGGFGGILGPRAAGIGGALKEEKAVVAITLRIVDTETSEVLETAEARGESARKSANWGAMASSWRHGAAASSDMTSSNFQNTIIGEATSDAVNKIVTILNDRVPKIKAKEREVEGRIANINGCTLYLSVGGNDGVQVGDHFEIHKIIKEVLEPDTKEVLDKETEKVGEFVAVTVRDKVTIGQYGGAPISMGYAKGYAARLVLQ